MKKKTAKRKKAKGWPKSEQIGNVIVRIYRRRRADGKRGFEVSDYTSGARRLRSFPTMEAATKEAKAIATKLAAGDVQAAQFRGPDAAAYGRAVELLRPTGDAIELACSRYAEAAGVLGNGSLLAEACRFYQERNPANLPDKTVEAAVAELIAVKQQQGASRDYITDLKVRLGKLEAAFPNYHVAAIGTPDIQRWLDAMKAKPQTVLNCRRVANALFAFCEARGFIPRGLNPVTTTERPKVKGGPVAIYSPKDLAELLAKAPSALVPALAVAAFCGLRTAELMRLAWPDVDIEGGFITVAAEKSKTATCRLAPIPVNLAAWLAPFKRRAGPIWHQSEWQFARTLRSTATKAKVVLKDNGLRHSFASYRLAQVQDAAKVALEMGNSPAMVFAHYRELTQPTDAAKWFGIEPQRPANVTPMESATA